MMTWVIKIILNVTMALYSVDKNANEFIEDHFSNM